MSSEVVGPLSRWCALVADSTDENACKRRAEALRRQEVAVARRLPSVRYSARRWFRRAGPFISGPGMTALDSVDLLARAPDAIIMGKAATQNALSVMVS